VSGYVKAKEFLTILRYFGEGAHEKGIKFEDFSKSEGN
jgi:thioredoxin-related protein